MDSRDAIRQSLGVADMVAASYLEDLDDAELFVRPVEGANHTAWQLGHLITSENRLMEGIRPGAMPALPEGFADKYTSDTSKSDEPGEFHTKQEYLQLLKQQREATLEVLEQLSDEDLDQPSPEQFRKMFPTVGAILTLQAAHTLMHAGQWTVLRRKLGKPVLF